MPIEALGLVIVGALLHALWNFCAKRASGGAPFVFLYGLVSCVAAGPICMAYGYTALTQLSGFAWLAIIASSVVHILYSLVLQHAYRVSDFSLVYPLARGSAPLLSVLGALLWLGEWPTATGALGIACLILGVLFISGAPQLLHSRLDSRCVRGLLWGLLTGACIACYTLIDGWAIKVLQLPPALYYALGLLLRTGLLWPWLGRSHRQLRAEWQRHWPLIISVGLLSPLAYLLVLSALTRAPLSYVAPARELSMLIGAWLGAKLLQEANVALRLWGILLLSGGVLLLVWA